MFILRSCLMLAVVIALAACQTTGATSVPASFSNTPAATPSATAVSMVEGPAARPPIGYIGFCLRHRADCEPQTDTSAGDITTSSTAGLPSPVALTSERWRELNEVNTYFNRTVRPVEDIDLVQKVEWWSYAINSAGDCEDYVLEKRRALIDRGWPADALLITVVRQWNGQGHAVLTVVTDKGDLVLDNLAMGIVSFDKAPYTWLMRQSRQHPMHWVKLNGEGTAPHTAGLQSNTFVAGGPLGL